MSSEISGNIIEANIAIVLTDIIGSTRFVEKNGKYAAAKWFSIHDKLVMSLITKHSGQWLDNSDGTLMYFGNVQDAIAFAFQYKKYLRVKKFPFRSRIGIHWDTMLIVKTEQSMISGGAKRLSIEGIGKNVAARTMSLCSAEQILLSKAAFLQYKKFGHKSHYIPKDALTALVGLYSFKGIKEPEAIFAAGRIQAQLQPPPDSEKAKRIGGAKKIKTRLKHKRWSEIFFYFLYRIAFIQFMYILYVFWPLISSEKIKVYWQIDYWFLRPFEYLDYVGRYIWNILKWFYENS